MPHLIWARQALLDVQRLYRFLAPRNRDAATRAVSAIRRGVQMLCLQPGLGRPIEGMDEAFRDWIIDFGDSGYVVRYRLEPRQVIVLAVRHQRDDPDKAAAEEACAEMRRAREWLAKPAVGE